MTIVQLIYNFLASGLALIALPAVWCRERDDPQRRAALAQRLGYGAKASDTGPPRRPKLWIHAVSVGEVKAAEIVVNALDQLPGSFDLLLTTTTTTGQAHARRQLGDRATVRFAPVDLWWSAARFLCAHRPDVLVCMETEIWPNWIAKAHNTGVRIAIVNGRISPRSIRSYRRIRPLLVPVLRKVDAFSMISQADAGRIIGLGAAPARVRVNGNVKMDTLDPDAAEAALDAVRQRYAVTDRTPVFVAGSIRGAELEILVDVYTRLAQWIADLVFIAAPRHIENAPRLARLADDRGLRWQFRTALAKTGGVRQAPVVILDTIGELRSVYGIATTVFCG
ncbi:MAG TPA: glycosyltransferase N-terminal domain-containing protein, partial [Desulfosarcina sp.]|nr:glycosyltransferase N-terminal domain-containing protein [Desulfosarcina sp.]